MKKVVLLAISAILMISCTKEIEFKGEQTDSRLVINCIAEVGQPIKAYIGKSCFFLDNDGDTQAPDDLEASLYVNGNLIRALTPRMDTVWNTYSELEYQIVQVFCSDYCPSVGDVVKICASAQGFEPVEGTSNPLPAAVNCQFANITVTNVEPLYSYYDEYTLDSVTSYYGDAELLIEISDPNPGQTNYFGMHIKGESLSDYDGYIMPSYNDPVFGITTDNNELDWFDFSLQSKGLFTDVIFDGKSHQIKVPISFYYYASDDTDSIPLTVSVVVEHVTKEYYNYLNTCEQGIDYIQLFSEPVQVYTNVNNGYGIIGGRMVNSWLNLPFEKP